MSVSFEMFRGDTAPIGLNFVQKANRDAAFDLTGIALMTITADTRQNPTDETTQLWSVAMTIVDATDGETTFALNSTQADMDPDVYWFDVEATYTIGSTLRTLFKGRFRVTQDLNKA